MMNENELIKKWMKYEKIKFDGWDFSHIKDSWENESLPWDYADIVKNYLSSDLELLDMGTGGGEFLLTLNHPYSKTSVTEGWKPNIELLRNKLEPLGIKVAPIGDDGIIDYGDNRFDMIINRHESFNIEEVKRVLKPNGIFITQQVGGKNGNRLSNMLIPNFLPKYEDLSLRNILRDLKEYNFDILFADEYFPYQKFFSMEALIYYAKVIEWEFPGFNVKNNFNQLLNAYDELKRNGYIRNYEHRFLIVAFNNKQS
ncbi:class I SAM-dependent methyltransferase [Metabacillus litoralis]|uniref:class I SAM-dependent methyltransferase n=1 Tax=Metabacillus litoralis TaxID=152268 RepID=UPI00203EA525|nr:methyltransferase domain-containing protein [Metabacillus litoralis]MCM3413722.1 class I SAM-dependent methyltransferase [Metabacillus litoralis]